MKTLHISLIIGITGMTAIGITSFALIDLQSKNNESTKYVFEGKYEISKDMTGSIGGKSFFVSQLYPENYVNDSIQFHGVIFSTLDRNGDTDPSGFVSNLVRFSDGINETLTTGYGGHPPNMITILTKHQNPQAGLTRYNNGSVNFLVNAVTMVLGITDLDILHSTTENPLGIKARVIVERDTAISCIQKCDIPPTPHLVLSSEKGAQFTGYQVCNGISCKKDNLDNSLYVHLEQVPQNYSGAVSLEASHINLGDLQWNLGDTIHVIVKAIPVTLQPNNVVTRELEKTMTVDLGQSKIIGDYVVNTPTAKNLITDTQNNNTFGVTALVKYTPYDACLGFSCPPYTYYLKMNSNSTAYLFGYDICGSDLCVKKDGLSNLLPLRDPLAPNYTTIGLDENSRWNYGDTVDIILYLGSTSNSTTVHVLNIKNSTIVP